MHYVENDGVRIAYRLYGQGEPLVLIHGWSNEGRYWEEFGYVRELSDKFQLIVPDLRGHGDSDTPASKDYSDAAFASDVIAVLDELRIDSAYIFGYSLGGWVVFELAANYPSRVRRAIAGGAHPYEEDLSQLKEFSPTKIVAIWEELSAPLSAESKQRLAEISHQMLIDILANRVNQAERLMGLTMPFLMICGTEDWRFEEMHRFSQEKEGCRFSPLNGLDHLTAWLAPNLMIPPLVEFLRR